MDNDTQFNSLRGTVNWMTPYVMTQKNYNDPLTFLASAAQSLNMPLWWS
jgi:hypothetical protein